MPTTQHAPADTEPAPSPVHNEPPYVATPLASDDENTLFLVTEQHDTSYPLLMFRAPPWGNEENDSLVLTPERALEISAALTTWALAEMRAGR